MAKLFDTHAHYFAEKFNELEGGAEAILGSDEFRETVGRVICVGSDPINSRISVDLARKYDFMYAAVGIHRSRNSDYGCGIRCDRNREGLG